VRLVRTGRRGREREIKEMEVKSDERKRVQGVINYSGTNWKKNVFGTEEGEKMKGRSRREEKRRIYSSH
jgi:hypothetical protein